MAQNLPRVVMAALRGGSGKTTLTLGLIQALRDRGLRVAPFKKGPDYIDPLWHTEAAQAQCHNLDPYLMTQSQIVSSFGYHSLNQDAAVIEGNRGLFDGKDAKGSYSTSELAKTLKAPLVLAIDCTMASRTVAAIVLGCNTFDPELNLAGVVLNPVGTKRQQKVVTEAIEQTTQVPVLGAVPRLEFHMPERHMGLVPPQEHATMAESLRRIGRQVAGYVDVDKLWEVMQAAPVWDHWDPPEGIKSEFSSEEASAPVIGVIRDSAFGFYYEDNLAALRSHGARLVFISALEDQNLPRLDALYIGGGFPETHADRLSRNQNLRRQIKAKADEGLLIYAECGGLMYLGDNLVIDEKYYPMAGVFPIDFHMREKPVGHGYSACQVVGENPLFPQGLRFKAHEFHYSKPLAKPMAKLNFAYKVERGKGVFAGKGGLVYRNVLGTYHHVHALGLKCWAASLVKAAKRAQGA
jgi:cobyrinic acid a,c-diamide synthase